MKHIKTFEGNREYKKFLLISGDGVKFDDYGERKKYYIVKYFLQSGDILAVKFLFGYNDPHNFETIRNFAAFNLNINNTIILYQSDKLYECREQLNIIEDTNKYNI